LKTILKVVGGFGEERRKKQEERGLDGKVIGGCGEVSKLRFKVPKLP